MSSKQILGLILLITGIAAILYGLSIQDTAEYKLVAAFGGDTSRVATLMIGGIVVAIAGLLLLIFGGKKSEARENIPATKTPDDFSDINRYDGQKLSQIAQGSSSFRPEVVQAARAEIQLRQKCEEFLPQVREKGDDELRDILAHPALYTDELLRCSRIVLDERLMAYHSRQQALARQQSEEARKHRRALWKKLRPYTLALLALIVIAIGVGLYYQHRRAERLERERQEQALLERQQQERERKLGEQQRIAAAQQAEQQRAAEKKRQEEEQAERQRQALAQNEADRKRREAGYYRIGELYEKDGVQGVVFSTDETGLHGKILSLRQERLSWSSASRKGSLPSRDDLDAVRRNLTILNKAFRSQGATPITEGDRYWLYNWDKGIVWYYTFDQGSSDDGTVGNCTETDVRSQPYLKLTRWVYEY